MTSKPRQRRKHGLRRVEVRVPASEIPVIRRAATILRTQGTKANMLRMHLGFGAKPTIVTTALDIFAMTEALSPEGEALWNNAMARIERERRYPCPVRDFV